MITYKFKISNYYSVKVIPYNFKTITYDVWANYMSPSHSETVS